MFLSVEKPQQKRVFHPHLLAFNLFVRIKFWCRAHALLSTQEVVNHNLSEIQTVSNWTLSPETAGFANIRSFAYLIPFLSPKDWPDCAQFTSKPWQDVEVQTVFLGGFFGCRENRVQCPFSNGENTHRNYHTKWCRFSPFPWSMRAPASVKYH